MITQRKLTIKDFVAMAEFGLLDPDERLELIDGSLYAMSPPSSRHAAMVDRLAEALSAYQKAAIVRVQNPIALSEHDLFEPDVALVVRRADFYESAYPQPEEVLLVVEVSLTSLAYDRTTKLPAYARAGIPEVWLVDLDARQLEVYREPRSEHYRTRLLLSVGEALTPVAVPDASAITF